ncbi:Cellulose-binding domain protein [Minicystis rosea]|nr:Cellulose-binding domain protein [Minicystis rosea]
MSLLSSPLLRALGIAATLGAPAVIFGACSHDTDDPGDGSCASAPTLVAVETLFASRCAGSSCHGGGSGSVFPPLAGGAPSAWLGLASHEDPSKQLVVPGHPEQSFLYMKVSGTQGPKGGALMPLGAAAPIPEAAAIHDWIAAGAPGSCTDGDAGPPKPVATDPNTLDQGQLFTCPADAPPASSPSRIRRIDSPELTSALPQALNGWFGGSKASGYLNPFNAPATASYSTYANGVTIDTATLDLYFQILPEAPGSWTTHDPWVAGTGPRIEGINDDGALSCMFGSSGQVEPSPTDACIDTFVDRFLTLGVLARAPTSAEHANLRALLKTTLATEGGDVSKRPATLALVGQAAWLTSGALFRSEMGAPVSGDAAHRNRLSNEELALTVGGMLSFHRPGAPMLGGPFNAFVGPPDPDDVCHPWLHLVSEAAADGSIQEPATIKKLITAYGGGVDPGGQPLVCQSGQTVRRRDLSMELDERRLGPRGEYWLAPRIAGFFREWLGYGNAENIFKDTPGLTSKYMTTADMFDTTTLGFENLQSGYYGYEATLVAQMDDTVARTVLDAASSHEDVFEALMTTRLFRLPSDRVDTDGTSCAEDSDCTSPDFDSCSAEVGLCVDSIAKSTVTAARVFDVDGVPATDEGRWVTMPAKERSGVLTHPAWLVAHGNNFQDDPSLVHRGKWVRQNLFCETVPGLELVMVQAKLGARDATLSARDRVQAATDENATCVGCHRLMNTLGYPFEMYNHAGFLRALDKYEADGTTPHPPDATSTIDNLPDQALNVAVEDAVDFAERIGSSAYARRCFIRQAFRYFMGRDETMADQCTLAAMEHALDQGSFFDMVAVLASSDTVLYRTTGGQP